MTDFDEYEYLEKTVENPELKKEKQTANGGDRTVKSEERGHSRSSKHKDSEKDGDVDHHFKHSKSGDVSRDYDRQKERSSSRHRSRSRDGDKEKDQHRSSRGNRDTKRDRDRDNEDKCGRERDRDRGVDRDRDVERNRRDCGSESEREKERSQRSKSRSERHRSDLDDRYRETSRDREYRDGERSRDKDYRDRERVRDSKEPHRENRRHKEKKEEAAEPEVDPERDQRTVFAYQVRDVRLIMDRSSRRSKGVGYIEFYDVMSVPMAIALSGQHLLSQPVMVKPSEAEKNWVQPTTSVATGPTGLIGPYSGGARRLYVGNLHSNITEADLRRFTCLEDARNAQNLNGQLEIGGRTIKVSVVTDQSAMQEVGGNTDDIDDDEGGGLSLNACSRALLMQKLDRSGTASSVQALTYKQRETYQQQLFWELHQWVHWFPPLLFLQ